MHPSQKAHLKDGGMTAWPCAPAAIRTEVTTRLAIFFWMQLTAGRLTNFARNLGE